MAISRTGGLSKFAGVNIRRARSVSNGPLRRVFRSAAKLLAGLLMVLALGSTSFSGPGEPLATTNTDTIALEPAELAARQIKLTQIGQLYLPTGAIVACDPLISTSDWPALRRKVEPGSYPVSLYEAQGRVALAVLRFAPGKPVRWEAATVSREDASMPGEIVGYPVDAGLGSFMDKSAMPLMSAERDRLGEDKNYYDDVLAAEFTPNGDRFAMHKPLAGNPVNIAMFWSGWGDGFYSSFWGLDEAGEPLVLMTDFDVIKNADGRETDNSDEEAQ